MRTQDRQKILRGVEDLLRAVTSLVETVESVVTASEKGAAGRRTKAAASSGGGPRSAKLKRALKAHWAAMTPAERAARVRKMLAGRGLKPKPKTRAKGRRAGGKK